MSDSFYEKVVLPAEEADQFIQDTGNLPEITAAAEGLFAAIAQTRSEIAKAKFASRFPNVMTSYQMSAGEMFTRHASPRMRAAKAEEGEAGMKRATLESQLDAVESQVFRVIQQIIELRTDLIVSQQEF